MLKSIKLLLEFIWCLWGVWFFYCFTQYPSQFDFYRGQIHYGMLFFIPFLCLFFSKVIGVFPAIAISYFIYQGVDIGFSRPSPYSFFGTMGAMQLDHAATHALLHVLIISLGVLLINIEYFKKILGAACIVNSLMILSEYNLDLPNGFLLNNGVDAIFVACTIPFLYKNNWKNFVLMCIPIAAIVVSKSSTPFFMLLGVLGVLSVHSLKIKLSKIIGPGLIICGIAYLAYPNLLGHSNRLETWQLMLTYWRDSFSLVFGSGIGTYWVLAPFIHQAVNGVVPEGVLTHFHNEYLQVLFETGFVGLFFMLGLLFLAVKKLYAKKDYAVLASLIALSISALTWNPLRYMLLSIITVFVLRVAYDDPKRT